MPSCNIQTVVSDSHQYLAKNHWYRVTLSLFVVFYGIGIAVGIVIEDEEASKRAEAQSVRNYEVFTKWQSLLSAAYTRAGFLATTLAIAADGYATVPMNYSATPAERIATAQAQQINPTHFQKIIDDFSSETPGVLQVIYVCGGIVSQMWPVPFGVGQDLMNTPQTIYHDDVFLLVDNAVRQTEGPEYIEMPFTGHAIIVHHPIYTDINNKTRDTFWGSGAVMFRVDDIIKEAGLASLKSEDGMESVLWYSRHATSGSSTPDNIYIDTTADSTDLRDAIVDDGLRIRLPTGQEDVYTFLAMLPVGGLESDRSSKETVVAVVFVAIVPALFVSTLLYLALVLAFVFRHRRAPSAGQGEYMFMALITLRGAQPIYDREPVEAARMSAQFIVATRRDCEAHHCYATCTVGDRSLCIVSSRADQLIAVATLAISRGPITGRVGGGVSVVDGNQPSTKAGGVTKVKSFKKSYSSQKVEGDESHSDTGTANNNNVRRTASTLTRDVQKASEAGDDETVASSSFISTAVCHLAVACHAAPSVRHYDPVRDVYFYGTTSSLTKLCAAADQAQSGELAWTEAFEEHCHALDKSVAASALADLEASAIASHSTEEKGETTAIVRLLQVDDKNERSNEDPSVAMSLMSDPYAAAMIALVSGGVRGGGGGQRVKRGGVAKIGSEAPSSDKSAEATSVSRNATLLHIAVGGDVRAVLDVVRRVVTEERGAVISAHESVIVAAFNLLAPGGHHQVKAAETVMRLRTVLPNTPFVCSIHNGKVNALVTGNGLVMCSGYTVAVGRSLLRQALLFGKTHDPTFDPDAVCEGGLSLPVGVSGLCVLQCHDELRAVYECEAIDVIPLPPSSPTHQLAQQASHATVLYRLVRPRHADQQKADGVDDEWMYRVKDDEELSPFASANAIFSRIAAGDLEEAKRLWTLFVAQPVNLNYNDTNTDKIIANSTPTTTATPDEPGATVQSATAAKPFPTGSEGQSSGTSIYALESLGRLLN